MGDPNGFAGGSAILWDYSRNDPTNAIDPSGLNTVALQAIASTTTAEALAGLLVVLLGFGLIAEGSKAYQTIQRVIRERESAEGGSTPALSNPAPPASAAPI